jgi:hypothetical protein
MAGAGVTNPDAEMDDATINSAQMTRTSRSLQSAKSLAQEKLQEEGRAQFNVTLVNINERNRLEQEASKKEIEELKRQLQRQSLANQMPDSSKEDSSSVLSSGEEEVYVDEELDAKIKYQEDWMRRNGIQIPSGDPLEATNQEAVETPPAAPPNDDETGIEATL